MTSLKEVASYLPPTSVEIESLSEELDLTRTQMRVFRRYYGLDRVRLDPPGPLEDLLIAAASKLEGLAGQEHRVKYVVGARSIPIGAPVTVNPLHDVCRAMGLHRAVAFTVSQHACASGLLAVDLVGKMLAADGDDDGLAIVFTGERAFTRSCRVIPETTITGEGSAACLVGTKGGSQVLSYVGTARGKYHAIPETARLTEQFRDEYTASLARVIQAAVAAAGLNLNDVSMILPHNVNRISWTRTARELRIPTSVIFLNNVPMTGHCQCADPFINYRSACDLDLLRAGDICVMASVGLGAIFSALVFEHAVALKGLE